MLERLIDVAPALCNNEVLVQSIHKEYLDPYSTFPLFDEEVYNVINKRTNQYFRRARIAVFDPRCRMLREMRKAAAQLGHPELS